MYLVRDGKIMNAIHGALTCGHACRHHSCKQLQMQLNEVYKHMHVSISIFYYTWSLCGTSTPKGSEYFLACRRLHIFSFGVSSAEQSHCLSVQVTREQCDEPLYFLILLLPAWTQRSSWTV